MKKLCLLVCLTGVAAAQTVSVTGTVALVREGHSPGDQPDPSNAVIWLKPVDSRSAEITRPPARKFEMRQQRKRFDPHVLVVPAGSTVSFPNLDPFFHNVFSMFDGKRFDLGLYEAGASHSAQFDRTGVCFIFCNVHPEMSGIVVVLDTTYYAVTNRQGEFTIPMVPVGRYVLSVWHERGKPEVAADAPRVVSISPGTAVLPPIRLRDSGQLFVPHKNKYGTDYETPTPKGLIYK